jgi:hypothetical protein
VRDRRIVEVGHDTHLRAHVTYLQDRLERPQVGALRAHDRRGAGDARVEQRLGEVPAARQQWDAPAEHDPRQALIRLVAQHDHPRARQVQLLDRAQRHVVQAAHDHVAAPVAVGL